MKKQIKIFLDDSWTDWMEIEEARFYKFSECIFQELMTREEYLKLYFDFTKIGN